MLEAFGVVMTDEVTRNNHKFQFSALLSAYEQSWQYGTPSNLNHDSTKFGGWNFLAGIYMEPQKAYVTNRLCVPNTQSEYDALLKENFAYLHNFYYIQRKEQYDELKRQLGVKWSDDLRPAYTGCIAYDGSGIVLKVFPEIANITKKGLININELEMVMPGVYKRDNYLLFAHRYLRRNCSLLNSLNDPLLECLHSLDSNKLEIQIAIDPDLIGLAGSETREFEYQYWWGPKFSNDLDSIPPGVTRHQNEHYDNIFSSMCFTEFGWYTQDGHQTFECEEVVDQENIVNSSGKLYGCRFVHSMLNPKTGLPYHLDGAIRAYSDEQMLYRLESDISESDRNTVYTKLWRIDNDISVDLWKEIISQFYRDNMLIGEYFDGKDEKYEKIVLEDQEVAKNVPMDKYIPINIQHRDGLRIYFSRVITSVDFDDYDIKVTSPEFLYRENMKERVMESDTISLLKLLTKKGLNVRYPFTKRIMHEDTVYNFPIISCRNLDCAIELQKTILELCNVWCSNGDDRIISYTVDLPQDNYSIRVSFIGHVADFVIIYNKLPRLFSDESTLNLWLEQLYEINNGFLISKSAPKIGSILSPDGSLRVKRKMVPPQYLKNLRMEGNYVVTRFTEKSEIVQELVDNKLAIAPIFELNSSQCSNCGAEYYSCGCNKFTDENCCEKIVKATQIGAFWTNRHADFHNSQDPL